MLTLKLCDWNVCKATWEIKVNLCHLWSSSTLIILVVNTQPLWGATSHWGFLYAVKLCCVHFSGIIVWHNVRKLNSWANISVRRPLILWYVVRIDVELISKTNFNFRRWSFLLPFPMLMAAIVAGCFASQSCLRGRVLVGKWCHSLVIEPNIRRISVVNLLLHFSYY